MGSHMHSGRFERDDEQVQEIRRRMAALRRELRDDIEQVGESAQAISDWRYYVRRYPWATVAAAAAVGFLIVPKRAVVVTPKPDDLAKLARREKIIFTNKNEKASSGVLGSLAALAMTAAMRSAMAYVGNNLAARASSNSSTKGTGAHTDSPSPAIHKV